MKLGRIFSRFRRMWKLKPYLVVDQYGQRTPGNHRYCVSLHSFGGTMGLAQFPATDAGDAQAIMFVKSINHIAALPAIDVRGGPGVVEVICQ